MKHLYITLTLLTGLFLCAKSQTVLLTENFDDSTYLNALPPGWTGSTGGFFVEYSLNNISTGYTGASGNQNLVIKNLAVTDTYFVQTPAINVSGYGSLDISYGVRNSTTFPNTGSAISSFDYSFDGGITWTSMQYVNNLNNSTWALINNAAAISITVPAGAATCMLRWTAIIINSTSGTYRIDDLIVAGTGNTSTNTRFNVSSTLEWFSNPVQGNTFCVSSRQAGTGLQLLDVSGRQAASFSLMQGMNRLDVSYLPKGVYLLQEGNSLCAGKIIIM